MVKPVPQEVGIVNKLEASQFALPRPKIPTRGGNVSGTAGANECS